MLLRRAHMMVSLLLLLLLTAAAVMWARSYRRSDSLQYNSEREARDGKGSHDCLRLSVGSNRGKLTVSVSTRRESGGRSGPFSLGWQYDSDKPYTLPYTLALRRRDPNSIVDHEALYIVWRTVPGQAPERQRHLRVAYGLLCLAILPVPAWYVVGVIRRRARRETWRCVECGYDLRASPERCPECGTPPPPPPAFLLRRVRLAPAIACAFSILFVAAAATLAAPSDHHFLTPQLLLSWVVVGSAGAIVLIVARTQRRPRTREHRHAIIAAGVSWAVGFMIGLVAAMDKGFGTVWSL